MNDLIFFVATLKDGKDIHINAREVVAFYANEDGGTVVHTTRGEYQIREYPEALANFICRYIE